MPLVALVFAVCNFLGVDGEKDYYDILGVGNGERNAFPFSMMISGRGVRIVAIEVTSMGTWGYVIIYICNGGTGQLNPT